MTDKIVRWLPILWFALLVSLIVAPWWANTGYVWMLDSVWGPNQPVVTSQPSFGILWQLFTHALIIVLSAPIAEKVVLTGVILAIGLSGYYLASSLVPRAWAVAAGTMYLLNPFVFERLAAGQWIVLSGYALLPTSLALAARTLATRGQRGAFRLAAVLVLYPLISPHFAYINAFLLAALTIVFVILNRPKWLWSKRMGAWAAAVIAAGLIINWFWLASPTAQIFRNFTSIDFLNFRTSPDPHVGVWGNVLGLYGFWRGSAFIEPKDLLGDAWILVAIVVITFAAIGTIRAFRTRSAIGITLAIAVPIAAVIAVGYSSSLTRPLIDFLIRYLPGFKGLRDTAKLVGVLALAYAMLGAYGGAWLTAKLPSRATMVGPLILIMLAAISVTGIWDGLSRQVPVADYPKGWYAVASRLDSDPHASVVILPWHDYLRLNFIQNTYAAQPAGVFFKNPVLVSHTFDNVLYSPVQTPTDQLMLRATTGQISASQWATSMRHLGATYVLLEKTDDWAFFAPLTGSRVPLYQDSDVALYKI